MRKTIALILGAALATCSLTSCFEDRFLTEEEAIYEPYCRAQTITTFYSCIDQLTETSREKLAEIPKCKADYLNYMECYYSYADSNFAKKNCDANAAIACQMDNYLTNGAENHADTSPMTEKECYDEYCKTQTETKYSACELTAQLSIATLIGMYPECKNEVYHMMNCKWPLSDDEYEVQCDGEIRKLGACTVRNGYTR